MGNTVFFYNYPDRRQKNTEEGIRERRERE